MKSNPPPGLLRFNAAAAYMDDWNDASDTPNSSTITKPLVSNSKLPSNKPKSMPPLKPASILFHNNQHPLVAQTTKTTAGNFNKKITTAPGAKAQKPKQFEQQRQPTLSDSPTLSPASSLGWGPSQDDDDDNSSEDKAVKVKDQITLPAVTINNKRVKSAAAAAKTTKTAKTSRRFNNDDELAVVIPAVKKTTNTNNLLFEVPNHPSIATILGDSGVIGRFCDKTADFLGLLYDTKDVVLCNTVALARLQSTKDGNKSLVIDSFFDNVVQMVVMPGQEEDFDNVVQMDRDADWDSDDDGGTLDDDTEAPKKKKKKKRATKTARGSGKRTTAAPRKRPLKAKAAPRGRPSKRGKK